MTASPDNVFWSRAPAFLYDGTVMHQRMKPFTHRFSYKVWSLLADIDRLSELKKCSRFFSHNRFNIFAFFDKDFGPDDGSSLRTHIDRLLAEAKLAPPERIFLLCYPRVLGYTFNPIAVYYCFDAFGTLMAMVYEVRNTFGDKHSYVVPVIAQTNNPASLRQERGKLLYVSPFLGFGLTYRFRLSAPADRLLFRILEVDEGGPVLAASFSASQRKLTSRTLFSACLSAPLLGLKVMALIHWEALKLWVKGARLVTRPPAPPPASIGDESLGDPPRLFHPSPSAASTKVTPHVS